MSATSIVLKTAAPLALLLALCGAAPAQTTAPDPAPAQSSPEITACKKVALERLARQEPEIKDIYIDEDGATIAVAEAKIADTAIRRIVMAEAYLRTDKSDKPRRFLCLIGEDSKVLLTFFTAR